MRVPSQLLRQHVQVRDRTEDLGDGPGYGTSRRVRCRLDWRTQLVRTSSGEDITVVGTMLIRPETSLAAGAEVTIDGDARTVVDVVPIFGPGAKLAGRTGLIQ
ncbi:hypothetical protein [Blastococcus sp. CT_GayMR16]|uniref:hypothetical protein n=1 Tax=Blastococcus sp. CT_GayMR16 TaxID=2559607 RepID=UPI0010730FAC|nr:hypothetical protein [Blastococcus sp. CT_GayMR16]TFV91405.1 hypothetical protein E4P38_02115 [Blastococcus sp. CT_GayMR16]